MDLFSGRLLLQKKVYLLQEMGLNMGYDFKFYIHGPYSSQLATDGYKVNLKENLSDNETNGKVFDKLISLEKNHNNDQFWFELLATIVYLRKNNGMTKEEIRQFIIERKPYLYTEVIFSEAYSALISEDIIS